MKKTSARLALGESWRRLWRYWPGLLVVYAVNLLSAVALALLPANGLLEAARRPALTQAAGGISAGMIVDFLGAGLTNTMSGINPDGRAFQLSALWVLLAGVLLPFVAGLPAALLNGGLTLVYVEAPAPWKWKRFAWGCWHWFGSFILLGLSQVLLTVLVVAPAAVLIGVAATRWAWAGWALALLLAVVLAAGLALFETAAVWLVAQPSLNFARALWTALRYGLGQVRPLAAIYAVLLLGLGLAHLLYNGLWPLLPLAAWPLVLVVQQGFILTRLAARLLRLGACAALIVPAAVTPAAVTPTSMPPSSSPG